MFKQFVITFSLNFFFLTIAHGQNCKKQTIDQLQGIWIREGFADTMLLIIYDRKLEFNLKGARNWNEPYTINIKNKIPQIPDSIDDCKFIELVNVYDTSHYKISRLTDSILSLTKYSIPKTTFFYADDKPLNYSERVTIHYRKTKGLPKNYNFKETICGTWWDENTKLLLKSDSTFSISFSKSNYEYSTSGKFSLKGNAFVLKDLQNKQVKHLLFDENNEIHLYYNWLGLELRETHMILTKMR